MSEAVATGTPDVNACTLSPTEVVERVAQWKAVAAEVLGRRSEPGKVVSVYPRRDDVTANIRKLIEAEARCCPFLSFDLREGKDMVEVELRYPPELEPVINIIAPEAASQ